MNDQTMIQITQELARMAAWDAGNRNMADGGRREWNEDDFNVATDEFNRLWPWVTFWEGGSC